MKDLLNRAVEYTQSKGILLVREPRLGAGTDGTVWFTSVRTAVKAFERSRNYHIERDCYLRLLSRQITQIGRFAVPEMEGYRDDLLVLEMSIVQPPFLLDFGKAYLDQLPPYHSDETLMENWRAECEDLFGDNWPEVQSVLNELQGMGIFYVDPKPANIRFSNEG